MLLSGKKVLITGSSRGIGKAITEKFLSEGASVWGICTKPSQYKDQFEAMAKENGGSFCEMYANAANAEEWSDVIKSALAASEGFDVLVNNAGITRDGLSFRMKKEDWDSVISINLTSAFLACQIVSSDMIRKRAGSIINMSSIVGVHGQGGQVNYSASKAGLIGLTKSLAKEAGSRGVRVNAIAPGLIDTSMAELDETVKKEILKMIPLKRMGKAQDVADLTAFLMSDKASYITRQVISVNGGLL